MVTRRVEHHHAQGPLLGLQCQVGAVQVPAELGVDAQRGVAGHHHQQLVEAVRVGGQRAVGEQPVAVHDAPDGVEGDGAVEHTEHPGDPHRPAAALGPAPLGHHAGRPPLGDVDVLVHEDHERAPGALEPRVQAVGGAGGAAEHEQLVGAAGAKARGAGQVGTELLVVVDARHEGERHVLRAVAPGAVVTGGVDLGDGQPPHEQPGGAQVALGVGGAHAEHLEQRCPRRRRLRRAVGHRPAVGHGGVGGGRGGIFLEAVDGVGRVPGVEQQLHDGGGGEEVAVGRIEEGALGVGEDAAHEAAHHPVVLQVRHRARHRARGRQKGPVPAQGGERVGQAGEHVGVDHAVDRARRQGHAVTVEIDLEVAVEGDRRCRPARTGGLHAVHGGWRTALLQLGSQPSPARPDLHNRPGRGGHRGDQAPGGRGVLAAPVALIAPLATPWCHPVEANGIRPSDTVL